ncbi:MAG TPA: hypothetical protein VFD59_15840 [Nocardioidaceae bacterium]|nr:hypothetical protein [Nocardioidaceae bacterium]
MPTPPPPADEVTRRALLSMVAGGTFAVVAGCTVGSGQEPTGRRERSSGSDRSSQLDPDVAVAAAALTGEQNALEAVEATLDHHRGLKRELAPALEAHRAHVSLLAEAAPEKPTASTSPSLPGPSFARFRVPDGERTARARISALERALSTSAKRHSFAAQSGAFARLLASMAASAAQHAALLASTGSSSGSSSAARP